MGVFDDKEYDALDWISQAVEPIKSPMNAVLAKLPDELVIDWKLYRSFNEDNYSVGLNRMNVVLVLAEKVGAEIAYDERELLGSCFDFEVPEGATLDFEKKQIHGTIKLIKTKKQLDEKELQKSLGTKGLQDMGRMMSLNPEDNDISRLNDIIEILDVKHPARVTRSVRKKVKGIQHLVKTILRENQWNIKDSDLADKLCVWIGLYLSKGNLAAYANVCKLKLMTHRGTAIYSMNEEKT